MKRAALVLLDACGGGGGESLTPPCPFDVPPGPVQVRVTNEIPVVVSHFGARPEPYAGIDRSVDDRGRDHAVSISDVPVATRTTLFTITQFSDALAMDPVVVPQIQGPGELVLPRLGNRFVTAANVADPDTGAQNFLSRNDVAPLPASIALDMADFAPDVTGISVYADEPARPTVSWTTSRPTTDETAMLVGVRLGGSEGNWSIVAPPDQPGALRFPDLPEELRPTAEVTGAGMTVIYSGRSPAYAEAHRQPFALLSEPSQFDHPDAAGVIHRRSLFNLSLQ